MAPGICFIEVIKGKEVKDYSHKPLLVSEPTAADPNAQREFRPTEDYLFVRPDTLDDFRVLFYRNADEKNSVNLSWISEVKHLALEASDASTHRSYALSLDLPYLPNLATLSFVFPASSGTIDAYSRVELSAEQQARPALRKLSDRELATLKLKADYTYDTWFDSHRIQWEASAAQYMETSFSNMERELAGSDREPVPACWDAEGGKLKLSFEALCFVGS
jgi:hypothetical protein